MSAIWRPRGPRVLKRDTRVEEWEPRSGSALTTSALQMYAQRCQQRLARVTYPRDSYRSVEATSTPEAFSFVV